MILFMGWLQVEYRNYFLRVGYRQTVDVICLSFGKQLLYQVWLCVATFIRVFEAVPVWD